MGGGGCPRWMRVDPGPEANLGRARTVARRWRRMRVLLTGTRLGAVFGGESRRLSLGARRDAPECARDVARALAERGWVLSARRSRWPDGDARFAVKTAGPTLRDEQKAAVDAVGAALGHFGAFVLHGVTGSGKTEVYLQLVERVLQQGRRALVLVPEIGLTPQLVGRFRDRFDTPMAVLHSALTGHRAPGGVAAGGQRPRAHRARYALGGVRAGSRPRDHHRRRGTRRVVQTTRGRLSVLGTGPGGLYEAQRADVPVLLGSATPALESLQNVAGGRAAGACRCPIVCCECRAAPHGAGGFTLQCRICRACRHPRIQAIQRHLGDDGQVLVYLNRSGLRAHPSLHRLRLDRPLSTNATPA